MNVNSTVLLSASVAVYVKVSLEKRPVGFPANARVPAVKVVPAGKVPVREYVNVPTPPLAVGKVKLTAVPTVQA